MDHQSTMEQQQQEEVQQLVDNDQVYEHDHEDGLAPGYRFRPTDAELIVYYLKAKIERGEHPPCRIHEVNVYDYSPDDLTKIRRSFDNMWYFLTPRERQCPNGSRPNRKVGSFGRWKASQSDTSVKVNGEEVGRKRSLFFEDCNKMKTKWLMHEYTTDLSNLPLGAGPQTMLSNCVLCKIYYKKETNDNNKKMNQRAKQVVGVRNAADQRPEIKRRQLLDDDDDDDEPSPKRTRLSEQQQQQEGASITSNSQYHDQSTADGCYDQQQNQQMMMSLTATNYNNSTSVRVSNNQLLQGASTTVISQYHDQSTDGCCYQQNQQMMSLAAINYNDTISSFVRVSDGGSTTSTPNDDQLLTNAAAKLQTHSSSNIMIVTTPPSSAETLLDIPYWDDTWNIDDALIGSLPDDHFWISLQDLDQ